VTQQILVDAENVIGTKEAAAELGIDIVTRMKEVGLNPELLDKQEGFISWLQFNDLLELIAKEDRCHIIGLYIGKYQPETNLGVLGQILRLCPNVHTALQKGRQYLNVFTQACYWEMDAKGGFVRLTRKPRFSQRETLGQSNTLGIVQTFKLLRTICGSDWKPTSISFVHASPLLSDRQEYKRFFRVPVSFDQETDSIFFPEHYLDRPIPTADRRLLAVVEEHANSLREQYDLDGDITDNVRLLIRRTLGSTRCNINTVAQMLDVHPKKLHRKLKAHGVTFKQLHGEERFNLACYYLSKSDIPLSILADLLDYSNATALSRAFKNHCGMYPQEWKKLNRPPK